jgi:hypothetical protein
LAGFRQFLTRIDACRAGNVGLVAAIGLMLWYDANGPVRAQNKLM